MLHFLQDCVFKSDSPLHHELLNLLEIFIAERIASRESEWFPSMFHRLRSLQSAVSEVQAKHVKFEQRINALQISAGNATPATEQRIDTCNSRRRTPREQQRVNCND